MTFRFSHESLDCYQLAVDVGRWFRQTKWPPATSALRDQGRRAIESVVLNIAEGHMNTDGHRSRHYRAALCSAAEACAVLDIVALDGGPETQDKLRRVGLMVKRLGQG